MNSISNALTVDVEDYFQVSAFEHLVGKKDWDGINARVEKNTHFLLELFAKHRAKATFFVLGWVAEKFPQVIKDIHEQGHEIASHGYWHRRASDQTKEEFREDVLKTAALLESLIGEPIKGYRAPSFSINTTNQWVYDVLKEAGHSYSSSVYPVRHDHYGIPDAPRFKYQTASGLWEIPLSTLRFSDKNIPISGGGYFRLYPYALTRWALKRHAQKDGKPYIFYMHPWEIDPDQPRMQGITLKTRFRHYLNLGLVEDRLERMLSEFNWDSMRTVFFNTNQ